MSLPIALQTRFWNPALRTPQMSLPTRFWNPDSLISTSCGWTEDSDSSLADSIDDSEYGSDSEYRSDSDQEDELASSWCKYCGEQCTQEERNNYMPCPCTMAPPAIPLHRTFSIVYEALPLQEYLEGSQNERPSNELIHQHFGMLLNQIEMGKFAIIDARWNELLAIYSQ